MPYIETTATSKFGAVRLKPVPQEPATLGEFVPVLLAIAGVPTSETVDIGYRLPAASNLLGHGDGEARDRDVGAGHDGGGRQIQVTTRRTDRAVHDDRCAVGLEDPEPGRGASGIGRAVIGNRVGGCRHDLGARGARSARSSKRSRAQGQGRQKGLGTQSRVGVRRLRTGVDLQRSAVAQRGDSVDGSLSGFVGEERIVGHGATFSLSEYAVLSEAGSEASIPFGSGLPVNRAYNIGKAAARKSWKS